MPLNARRRSLAVSGMSLVLLVLLAIICDPQRAEAETKVIIDADNGSKVHLRVGDQLEVHLKANPSTGYFWYVRPSSTRLLRLLRQTMNEAAGPNVGQPGVQVFVFEPRRIGEGTLQLHYVRSWETPSPQEQRFEVDVSIESGTAMHPAAASPGEPLSSR